MTKRVNLGKSAPALYQTVIELDRLASTEIGVRTRRYADAFDRRADQCPGIGSAVAAPGQICNH